MHGVTMVPGIAKQKIETDRNQDMVGITNCKNKDGTDRSQWHDKGKLQHCRNLSWGIIRFGQFQLVTNSTSFVFHPVRMEDKTDWTCTHITWGFLSQHSFRYGEDGKRTKLFIRWDGYGSNTYTKMRPNYLLRNFRVRSWMQKTRHKGRKQQKYHQGPGKHSDTTDLILDPQRQIWNKMQTKRKSYLSRDP